MNTKELWCKVEWWDQSMLLFVYCWTFYIIFFGEEESIFLSWLTNFKISVAVILSIAQHLHEVAWIVLTYEQVLSFYVYKHMIYPQLEGFLLLNLWQEIPEYIQRYLISELNSDFFLGLSTFSRSSILDLSCCFVLYAVILTSFIHCVIILKWNF